MDKLPQAQSGIAYYAQHPFDLFRNISMDIIILAIGVAAFMFYGLYLGKEKLASILISTYIGAFLYTIFPYAEKLTIFRTTDSQIVISQIIIYAVLVIICHLFVKRVVNIGFSFSKMRSWIDNGLLSLATVVSLALIGYKLLDLGLLYQPTLVFAANLMTDAAMFWTALVSLAILFFTMK